MLLLARQDTKKNIIKNVLVHQLGGEEIRIGVIWNRYVILDIFSVNGGDIHIAFTPAVQYIKEEFVDYGYDDISTIIDKIYEAEYICDQIPSVSKIVLDEPYHKIIELNTNHAVIVKNDSITIRESHNEQWE